MPTIIDVARLADVSIATVSRVLNGDAAVRPRTRRVVEEAIEQLDYRPNAAARSLRMARSRTLGLVVSDLANPVFIEVVQGIEAVARERGYSLFLCDAANDQEAQDRHLERLYERRVDGVILYAIGDPPAGLARFVESRSPVVTMGPAAFRGDYPGVLVSESTATARAIRHLLEAGHRRIGLVNRDIPPGRYGYRIDIIRREQVAAGIPWDPALLLAAHDGDDCRDRVATLLRERRPSALVLLAHPLIPYALQAVNAAGLRVPEDLSLIAFGDSPWVVAFPSPINVVRIDYHAWGHETAELLMRRLEAPDESPPRIRREAQYIERGSVAGAAG